jgi:hypothetical protein
MKENAYLCNPETNDTESKFFSLKQDVAQGLVVHNHNISRLIFGSQVL